MDNPYHNCENLFQACLLRLLISLCILEATHATDVLQTVHFFLVHGNCIKIFTKLEILALVIAAIVHDLEHDGYNNNFHKNSSSGRAIAHNDRQIQENHHLMSMFTMMSEDNSLHFLDHLSNQQQQELRQLIIGAVLATDMSMHFEALKEFKDLVEIKGSASGKWTGASDVLMKIILHCSDISNPAKPISMARKWAELVLEEFFKQVSLLTEPSR